jgi:hypothetical protein
VSGGGNRWFKGSTGKKRPVTGDNNNNNNNNNNGYKLLSRWATASFLSRTLPPVECLYKNNICILLTTDDAGRVVLLLWQPRFIDAMTGGLHARDSNTGAPVHCFRRCDYDQSWWDFCQQGQCKSGLSTLICLTDCLQWFVCHLTPLRQLTRLLTDSMEQSLSEGAGQEIPPTQNQSFHHHANKSINWSQSLSRWIQPKIFITFPLIWSFLQQFWLNIQSSALSRKLCASITIPIDKIRSVVSRPTLSFLANRGLCSARDGSGLLHERAARSERCGCPCSWRRKTNTSGAQRVDAIQP